jgi:hypothetical protein
MKDIEQLLKMTERPQDYTDEELQKLMGDQEMREYYELMVSAEAGFALRKEKNHGDRSRDSAGQNHGPVPMILPMILSLGNRFMRIAAMFIVVLMLSGIAFAAYRLVVGGDSESPTQEVRTANSAHQAGTLQQTQTDPTSIRTFENAELQQILQELSDYYHVSVEYRNEQSRHIRLYTKWDTAAPLQQIIELLNGFEKVSVRLIDNQIIAE